VTDASVDGRRTGQGSWSPSGLKRDRLKMKDAPAKRTINFADVRWRNRTRLLWIRIWAEFLSGARQDRNVTIETGPESGCG